jgi:hypothetical protein
VIEPSFGTLLIAAVGAAPLTAPSLLPAGDAAVALSAIAAGAEEEDCMAFGAEAKPLPQHYLIESRHASSRDWTTAVAPWQVRTSLFVVISRRLPYRSPAAPTAGFRLFPA